MATTIKRGIYFVMDPVMHNQSQLALKKHITETAPWKQADVDLLSMYS
jgi:hypothetical protein